MPGPVPADPLRWRHLTLAAQRDLAKAVQALRDDLGDNHGIDDVRLGAFGRAMWAFFGLST